MAAETTMVGRASVTAVLVVLLLMTSAQGDMMSLLPSAILPCPNQLSSQCQDGLKTLNTWYLGEVSGQAPNADPSQVADACNSCQQDWNNEFGRVANASTTWGAGCNGPNDAPSRAALIKLVQASTQYVCWPASGGVAGTCVNRVSDALRSAGLDQDVLMMNPKLQFTGSTLQRACTSLLPLTCCFRSWSMLMGAYAQQLCLPDLANQYLSLPGRCALAVPNAKIYEPCLGSSWAASLTAALQPLDSTTCGSWNSPAGGSGYWSGAACSGAQLSGDNCPSSSCDMYCSMAAAYQAYGDNADSASGDGNDKHLSTGVIVFVSVVSGVVGLLLLIALLMFVYMQRKSRHLRSRSSSRTYGGSESAVAGSELKARDRDSYPRSVSGGTTPGGGMMLSRDNMSTDSNTPHPSNSNEARLMRDIPVGALGVLLRGMNSSSNRPSLSSLGAVSGPNSMAVSSVVGRTSNLGSSVVGGFTMHSITHEDRDEIAPLPPNAGREPKGVSESLQPLRRSVGEGADASPVHYANALYGPALPPSPSPPTTPSPNANTTPGRSAAAAALALTPVVVPEDTAPPRAYVHRSSRSFSFGVDGASRLPPAHAVAAQMADDTVTPGGSAADTGWTSALVAGGIRPARSHSQFGRSSERTSPTHNNGSSSGAVPLPTGKWRTLVTSPGGESTPSAASFVTAHSGYQSAQSGYMSAQSGYNTAHSTPPMSKAESPAGDARSAALLGSGSAHMSGSGGPSGSQV